MKRVASFLAIAIMLVLLTGCGGKEKQMDCTLTNNQNGLNIKQVFSLNFDGSEKFKSAVLKQDMTLSEELLNRTSLDNYKEQFVKQWENTDYGDLNYKITDNGKDTATLTVDFSAKDIEKITGGKTSKNDLEDTKKALESANYTCKMID